VRTGIALLCLFFLSSRARAQDFQTWNEVDVAASWHRIHLLAPFVARVDPSLSNPQLAATGLTADFPLPWGLSLTGGYLFVVLPQTSTDVHVPLAAVTKSVRFGRYALADRNRIEKLFGYGNSPVRYRNRLLLDRPIGTGDPWHLFLDDEAIFNLTAGSWNQNRFQAGGGARLNRRLFLDVYYMLRNASGGSTATHVFGTNLRIALTRR